MNQQVEPKLITARQITPGMRITLPDWVVPGHLAGVFNVRQARRDGVDGIEFSAVRDGGDKFTVTVGRDMEWLCLNPGGV